MSQHLGGDDLTVLRKVFPNVRDIFHINGKFVIVLPEPEVGEWLIGQEKRSLLTEYGFYWEVRKGQIWINDR